MDDIGPELIRQASQAPNERGVRQRDGVSAFRGEERTDALYRSLQSADPDAFIEPVARPVVARGERGHGDFVPTGHETTGERLHVHLDAADHRRIELADEQDA